MTETYTGRDYVDMAADYFMSVIRDESSTPTARISAAEKLAQIGANMMQTDIYVTANGELVRLQQQLDRTQDRLAAALERLAQLTEGQG
jgi:hypothetical protein